VPKVFRHHHRHAGYSRDLGDVGIVDPSPNETVVRSRVKKVSLLIIRKLVNFETDQDFLVHETPGVGRREPQLFTQSGRDRVELQAAMPSRVWPSDVSRRNGLHDPLGGLRGRAQINEPPEQHTGQRSRS
jgi:hypothetical protein